MVFQFNFVDNSYKSQKYEQFRSWIVSLKLCKNKIDLFGVALNNFVFYPNSLEGCFAYICVSLWTVLDLESEMARLWNQLY